MTIYWMLQPIPLAVTALIPIVLFPLLGLATTEKACEPYLQSTNMLFMASLIVAIAMESSGFHKRIALRALIFLGDNIRTLFAGFMFTTMFLGIWIINTAATAMILPIADIVTQELFDTTEVADCAEQQYSQEQVELLTPKLIFRNNGNPRQGNQEKLNYIRRLLYICIAFSATIGGTTTLTSNGPNLVFQFVLDDLYNGSPNVDYANWLLFCLPATILSVTICWFLVCVIYLRDGIVRHIRKSPKNILLKKYVELGSLTFHELSVCMLFLFLIGLWMFRDPQYLPGWVHLLNTNIKPKDTTPAILIVILMFCIPKNPLGPFPSESILSWPVVQSKLAWGVILLRGGGFSMANTATSSGLTQLVGTYLSHLNQYSVPVIVSSICLIASFTTELASNSAIATIFLPISGQIAYNLNLNPLHFLIPVALSCSYAFILPVGTPANALVSSHANLNPSDMAFPGLFTKLVCLGIMLINLYLIGFPMFELDKLPEWAKHPPNSTSL